METRYFKDLMGNLEKIGDISTENLLNYMKIVSKVLSIIQEL